MLLFLMVFLFPINQAHCTYSCTFHTVIRQPYKLVSVYCNIQLHDALIININSNEVHSKGTDILLQQCYLLNAVNVRYITPSYRTQTSHNFSDPYHNNHYLFLSHQTKLLFNYMWQVIFPTNTSDLNTRHVLTSPNTTQNNVVFL